MNRVSVARTVALALAAFTAQAATAQAPTSGSADARLKALYEREWDWRQQQGLRSGRGGEGDGPTHLPRVDAATQKARLDYWTKALAELDAIPADQLSPEEKINAAVFRQSIETMANDIKYKTYEAPFNADTFFWSGLNPRSGGFATAQAYRNYIARMRDIPRFFDEQTANMRAGLARGFSVPQIAVQGRDVTIKPYLPADQTNSFYDAFNEMPPTIPAAEQAVLKAEGEKAIREAVAPAYAKLYAFIRDDYMWRSGWTRSCPRRSASCRGGALRSCRCRRRWRRSIPAGAAGSKAA